VQHFRDIDLADDHAEVRVRLDELTKAKADADDQPRPFPMVRSARSRTVDAGRLHPGAELDGVRGALTGGAAIEPNTTSSARQWRRHSSASCVRSTSARGADGQGATDSARLPVADWREFSASAAAE